MPNDKCQATPGSRLSSAFAIILWLSLCALWPLCEILPTPARGAEPPAAQEGVERGTCSCEDTLKPLSDPDPAVDKLLAAYNFPAEPFPWTLRLSQEADRYRVYHVTFPSPHRFPMAETNTVHAEYFVPHPAAGRGPAIVVLHILDERLVLERTICRFFAASGVPALLLQMPYYGERKPQGLSVGRVFFEEPMRVFDAVRAAVMEVRRAACWLQKRPEVDPDRVGLLGISLGAIVGSLAAGVEPRLARSVLVIGGGDPATIVWHAPETRGLRERLTELGYTRERVREATAGLDPLRFAKRVDRRSVLMINAANDQTIPKACTLALWEALGKPEISWYPAGHYSISLFIPVILPQALDFIRRPPPENPKK